MARYADIVAVRDALYEADAITLKGVRILNQFPTISPDEVRGVGEWIYDDFDDDGMDYQCSCCKQYSRINWNYCPSCGVRLGNGGTDDS